MKTFSHLAAIVAVFVSASMSLADDTGSPSAVEELESAKKKLTAKTYELRYKFAKGETLRWKVTHVATLETRIQGNTLESRSRSVSTKAWKVVGNDDDGKITFVNMVEDVDMWQHVKDRPEVRYNSKTDSSPPPVYENVAKTVGVPLATVTIDPHGQIISRQNKVSNYNFGLGEITLPLPDKAISVGHQWHWPNEIQVRLQDGRVQRIATRQLYALEKVQTGVATISVTTEVLTPVRDPQVKAQLAQQLTHGTIKFDVDAGRLMHKQMDWDETVIGIGNNGDGVMNYLARFTEELLTGQAVEEIGSTASENNSQHPTSRAASVPEVKSRDGKPLLRR